MSAPNRYEVFLDGRHQFPMVWMWLNCVIPGLSLPLFPLPKMLMISKSLRRGQGIIVLIAKRNLMSAPNRFEVFFAPFRFRIL